MGTKTERVSRRRKVITLKNWNHNKRRLKNTLKSLKNLTKRSRTTKNHRNLKLKNQKTKNLETQVFKVLMRKSLRVKTKMLKTKAQIVTHLTTFSS